MVGQAGARFDNPSLAPAAMARLGCRLGIVVEGAGDLFRHLDGRHPPDVLDLGKLRRQVVGGCLARRQDRLAH